VTTVRTRGFTFVEMVVVMAIVAIGGMLAVPMIEGGINSREVRRVARQIFANMNHCRAEAIATGKTEKLHLDPSANSMRACGGRWAEFTDRAVIEEIEGGIESSDGSSDIVFYPNGSTSGARILIASRKDRFGIRLGVRLDPLVGLPRVEE
jgi:prepilin-type N-terminal cleavage/methylation domain-containing protein